MGVHFGLAVGSASCCFQTSTAAFCDGAVQLQLLHVIPVPLRSHKGICNMRLSTHQCVRWKKKKLFEDCVDQGWFIKKTNGVLNCLENPRRRLWVTVSSGFLFHHPPLLPLCVPQLIGAAARSCHMDCREGRWTWPNLEWARNLFEVFWARFIVVQVASGRNFKHVVISYLI